MTKKYTVAWVVVHQAVVKAATPEEAISKARNMPSKETFFSHVDELVEVEPQDEPASKLMKIVRVAKTP